MTELKSVAIKKEVDLNRSISFFLILKLNQYKIKLKKYYRQQICR